MKIIQTELDGVYIIEPVAYGDNRGWFMESFRADKLAAIGINADFVQDNQSFSAQKGTLRGLHFQNYPYAQSKLVRCLKGEILDVAVDLRPLSDTYKKWIAVKLSEENKRQLYIPRGFAHGFLTLTDNVEIAYKVDEYYNKSCDSGIKFDDPDVNVNWGEINPVLSDKDKNAPRLSESNCNFGERILVTGVKGQLGFDVVKSLKQKGIECVGVDIDDFDLTNLSQVEKFLRDYKPTVIVHCAAYTAVDKAEDAGKDLCFAVNVEGTKNIARTAAALNAKFVYISTDYVYGGEGETPFNEDSATNPLNAYGLSKRMGEQETIAATNKHFILRTSWVFGKNGNNFVKTMLKFGKERTELNVVDDQIGSPTYTPDLTKLIIDLIFSDKYGIYNVSNEGFCSWFEFAKEIFRLTNTKIKLNPVPSSEYKTKAVRPLNSRLDKAKLERNGFLRLPKWQEALKKYIEEIL